MSYHKLPVKEKFKLWFFTLFYHSSFSFDYCVDVFIEPCFWFVDKFTRYMGKFFVTLVCGIVALVAFTAETLGAPFWWNRSPTFAVILHVIGYWILVNILFNYFQAVYVNPGEPIDTKRIGKSGVTVCKICISPKPPRTHHCSVCKKCWINMDHHCPWVNNCIGHYNHRYFYLTTVYILLGVVFVMLFGVELAYRQIFLEQDVLPFPSSSRTAQRLAMSMGYPGPVQVPRGEDDHDQDAYEREHIFPKGAISVLAAMLGLPQTRSQFDRAFEKTELFCGIMVSRIVIKAMIYMTGFLCIGASICLGGLAYWHGTLISNGETSIERHINKNNKKKQGANYINLYDLGVRRNWYNFLGLDKPGRTIWRHVLLPSRHKPNGDGYDWTHLLKHTLPRKLSE